MKLKSYIETARLYDYDDRLIVKADIDFLVSLAERLKPESILELACGTGRISIPLAGAGFKVRGVDISPAMLDRFREKLNLQSAGIRDNIKLTAGNMVDFGGGEKYDLVLIPFHSFQLLTDEKDAEKCLVNIRERLISRRGKLFLNVFSPFGDMSAIWKPGASHIQFDVFDETENIRVQKTNINDAHDIKNRIIYFYHVYSVFHADGKTERFEDHMGLKYYYFSDIKELLAKTGFAAEEEYGWYDGTPVGGEREFIFICSPADSHSQH